MSLYRRAAAMAKGLVALSPGLSFGPVDQHFNPKRQYRKKKMRELGLTNMKQFRKWEKAERRREKEQHNMRIT